LIPEKGDILHLQFDPSSGKEMKGNHYCLVVSPKSFNERLKLAMVCPISGGASNIARNQGFLISLMGLGLRTDGCVHVHQLKSLDWEARKAKKIESVPDTIIQEVSEAIISIFE
jgi:mRNA interferase ChpB